MSRYLYVLFVALIACKNYSQTPEETGKKLISTLFVDKDFEKAHSFFDESLTTEITVASLKEVCTQIEGQVGKYKSIIETNNEGSTYYYYSEFTNVKLDIVLSFNESKKIVGFFFVPHKEFKKGATLGKELEIKSNGILLKGTLLVPEKENLKKLVLFVHGSGPNDRDETVLENKPFKDIAESLLSKGIASFRFDKRTLTNPESFNDKSTIDDEVTSDVLNIIAYFKSSSEFSNYEITVLGHSLGAHMAPRIANKTNQIAKIILLAGNSRPLDVLINEQYEYLYKLTPTPELNEMLQAAKTSTAFLNSKKFDLSAQKDQLPLNLSAYYWKSLLDYKPLVEIQKVRIPILILQGERDYQVTMKDFDLWKKTLKNNPKASFKSYPKLNHLFMTGDAVSTPKEYMVKGNVDSNVINDIADFIIR